MQDTSQKREVEFTGNAREWFGIWIVNLLLTIVTLGIYSAWAKVRVLKYFHRATSIDDVHFDFDASPYNMPELHWVYGYPMALGVMGTMVCGMLFVFWRRGWLDN